MTIRVLCQTPLYDNIILSYTVWEVVKPGQLKSGEIGTTFPLGVYDPLNLIGNDAAKYRRWQATHTSRNPRHLLRTLTRREEQKKNGAHDIYFTGRAEEGTVYDTLHGATRVSLGRDTRTVVLLDTDCIVHCGEKQTCSRVPATLFAPSMRLPSRPPEVGDALSHTCYKRRPVPWSSYLKGEIYSCRSLI